MATNIMNTKYRLALLYGLIGGLMCILGIIVHIWSAPSSPPNKTTTSFGGAFSLLNGNGEPITEAIFADKPRAIMFGFTYCPDVCPAGLARMKTWIEADEIKEDKINFAFITVDPERDTPEVLAKYVGYFSDKILPLSGSPQQINDMLSAYGVYAKKVPLPNDNYTMDHHSAVFLFDSAGQFVEFIYAEDAQSVAIQKLKNLIAS